MASEKVMPVIQPLYAMSEVPDAPVCRRASARRLFVIIAEESRSKRSAVYQHCPGTFFFTVGLLSKDPTFWIDDRVNSRKRHHPIATGHRNSHCLAIDHDINWHRKWEVAGCSPFEVKDFIRDA